MNYAAVAAFAPPGLSQQPAQAPGAIDDAIKEIVVTGSYIRRESQLDSPSPLVTIDYEQIQDLGVNEISDVIERMTINTGSQNNPDAFTQNFSTGTTNINLRGLGVNSTLVMLNSRRQVYSGAVTNRGNNFVDTSALPPMIAFERIETLKDGATEVLWIGRIIGGGGTANPTTHDSTTWRVAAGLTGDFNAAWGWDVGFPAQ